MILRSTWEARDAHIARRAGDVHSSRVHKVSVDMPSKSG